MSAYYIQIFMQHRFLSLMLLYLLLILLIFDTRHLDRWLILSLMRVVFKIILLRFCQLNLFISDDIARISIGRHQVEYQSKGGRDWERPSEYIHKAIV